MQEGYVKAYRSLAEKGYSNKPEFLALWIHLLFLATYKERECFFDNKIHTLKPGQIITGRKKLSQIAGIEEHKVDRILKCFESEQQIEQQTFSKFRIITICNWDKYQQSEQQFEQEMSNKWATSEQQVSTNNKDKKDKKERIKHISEISLPEWLPKDLWEQFKEHRISLKAKLSANAEHLNLVKLIALKQKGYDPKEIIETTIANGWKGFYEPKNKPANNILKGKFSDKTIQNIENLKSFIGGE